MMSMSKHLDVRTTLTLDDDVIAKLRADMRKSRRSFKDAVNETLRVGLALGKRSKAAPRFVVRARDLGRKPGIELHNVGALLEQLEGPLHR